MQNIRDRREFILRAIKNDNLEIACTVNKETALLKVRQNKQAKGEPHK